MTKEEQIQFVHELAGNIEADIVKAINDGRIPESWDGLELRKYLADKARDAYFVKMTKGRTREYNNTLLVNNL